MFPKNKINVIIRLLCLLSFIIVIFLANSITTLLVLLLMYGFFALCEKSFRNIVFIVITIVILGICSLVDNFFVFRIMLLIDYCYYFLDTSYYTNENEVVKIDKNEYVRFSNQNKMKKKGSNDILAVYLTMHLIVLFVAIMVG